MTTEFSSVQIGLFATGGVIVIQRYDDGCETQIQFDDLESFDLFMKECVKFRERVAAHLKTTGHLQ